VGWRYAAAGAELADCATLTRYPGVCESARALAAERLAHHNVPSFSGPLPPAEDPRLAAVGSHFSARRSSWSRAPPTPTPNSPATRCDVAARAMIRLLYVTTSTRPPPRGRAPLATRFALAFRYNLPGPDTAFTCGHGLTRALPPPPLPPLTFQLLVAFKTGHSESPFSRMIQSYTIFILQVYT
jgi:hypothetical protein